MRLLFTDMDGTLLNQASRISPAMKEALTRMTERGHKLILASGRPLPAIQDAVAQAGLILPGLLIIANNGALIYDCEAKKPLLERRLLPSDVIHLFRLAGKLGVHLHTYVENAILTVSRDPETEYYCRYVHMPVREAGGSIENALTERPFKCLAIHLSDRAKLDALLKEAEAALGERVTSLFSSEYYLEFFDSRAGKGNALRYVCEVLHVPVCEVFAAGDAENDISMLQAAGTGIAMRNAAASVKKAAAVVTSRDNSHDGLMEIIEKYFM